MTEKDWEDLPQEQALHHQDQETKKEPPQASSAFLDQWKQRHQAHLHHQEQSSAPSEHQELSSPEERKALFAGLRRSFAELEQGIKHQQASLGQEEESVLTAPSVATKKPIPTSAVWKSVPVFLLGIVLLALSLYFISPLSKEKVIRVEGNQTVTTEQILMSSQLVKQDYAVTSWLQLEHTKKAILASQPRVSEVAIDVAFPNQFTIRVKEYAEIGYVKKEDGVYPILSNGVVAKEALPAERVPERAMLIQLQDQELVEELVGALSQLDPAILAGLESVELQPTKASADLLLLKMYDGHHVLVPLSELTRKLPYYPKVAAQLTLPSIIDMEVGVFSYPRS